MKPLRTVLNFGSRPDRKYDPPNWWRPRLERIPRLRCQAGHWAISWWRRQNTSYQDDHLPDHPGWHVELADAVIRILDMAGGLGVPLQELIDKKLEYNSRRPKMHGKSY